VSIENRRHSSKSKSSHQNYNFLEKKEGKRNKETIDIFSSQLLTDLDDRRFHIINYPA